MVEEAGDLWALERAGAFKGRYHVLGGVLSALDGVGPEDLRIPELAERANDNAVTEVVWPSMRRSMDKPRLTTSRMR